MIVVHVYVICQSRYCVVFFAVMEDAGNDVRSKRLARLQQQQQPQLVQETTTLTPRSISISSKEPEVRRPVAATTSTPVTATTPAKKTTDKVASSVKARICLCICLSIALLCLFVCLSTSLLK